MANVFDGLYPEKLWNNFAKLCQIPRPSKKEEKAVAFVKEFGEKLGLETQVDELGNVVIYKPATPGYENRQVITLQGHLDMVPQANSDTDHNFETDPIEAYVDGEWVTAKGTTLGSDNGMGVAAALSVLESTDLEHGPVEAFFTIDEETGMTGAFGLKPDFLKGDILINMDSEDEGELYVGCAGGMDTFGRFKYETEAVPEGYKTFKVLLTGLKGGHSGLDINLGKGNANKILNRFLWNASSALGIRVAGFNGGNLRNAIPREAFAEIAVDSTKVSDLENMLNEYIEMIKNEYSATEPEVSMSMERANDVQGVWDTGSQFNILNAIQGCPNGAISMVPEMPDVVETSTSMGIVKTENGMVEVAALQRGSVDSRKQDLADTIKSIFELAGAEVEFAGAYPGWKPNLNSPILNTMKKVYNDKFGKVPDIKVIHAGLECGIIGDVYPKMDLISFGPTIRYPHSPDEKVNIETVGKFWDFLVETLKNAPVK